MNNEAKLNYHVIILGAGVAGLSSALFLKKQGIADILIIDKNNHSLHKACSGILTEKSLKLLKEIDVVPSNYKRTKSISAYYNNVYSHTYSDQVYFYQNIGLNRVSLDEDLFNKCQNENIQILENINQIEININKNTVNGMHFDYLIDARGFSVIANKAKKKIIGIEAKIKTSEIVKEIEPKIFLSNTNKGYGWIVSYNDVTTIGFTNLYNKNENVREKLFNFALANNITINEKDADIRAAFIPVRPVKKLYNKNIIYIGERAGLNDALTQEGIFYALISAKYATYAIMVNNLSLYKKNMREILMSLKKAAALRNIFFNKHFQKKLWDIGRKHRFTEFIFHLYSTTDLFNYRKIIKYHKQYKTRHF